MLCWCVAVWSSDEVRVVGWRMVDLDGVEKESEFKDNISVKECLIQSVNKAIWRKHTV